MVSHTPIPKDTMESDRLPLRRRVAGVPRVENYRTTISVEAGEYVDDRTREAKLTPADGAAGALADCDYGMCIFYGGGFDQGLGFFKGGVGDGVEGDFGDGCCEGGVGVRGEAGVY